MRPIRLEFEAFGPFPGTEVVDFVSLDDLGLYLVSGPTGAGKTSIYDAMLFALYGKVPGARSDNTLRSDFATADATAEVSLVFEAQGTVWRTKRQPTQSRAKQRGSGYTTVQAKATLERYDGTNWQQVESRKQKVDDRVVGLVGLDHEQFSQVVLLPQGEFQKLLRATPQDRERLMRRLFATEGFDRAIRHLKDEAARAKSAARESAAEAKEARSGADRVWDDLLAGVRDTASSTDLEALEWEDDHLDAFDGHLARKEFAKAWASTLADARKVADDEAEAAESAFRELEADAGRFKAAEGHRRTLAGLEETREEAEEQRVVLDRGRKATPVVEALDELDPLEVAVNEAESVKVEAVKALVESGLEEEAVPATVAKANTLSGRWSQSAERFDGLVQVLADAVGREKDEAAHRGDTEEALKAVECTDAAITAKIAELVTLDEQYEVARAAQEELPDSVEAHRTAEAANSAVGDLKAARKEVRAAERAFRSAQGARSLAETALKEEQSRETLDMAGRLARDALIEGGPCPVCGSEDHPAPAVPPKARQSSALENADEALREAVAEEGEAKGTLTTARRARTRAEKVFDRLDLGDPPDVLGPLEKSVASTLKEAEARVGPLRDLAATATSVGKKVKAERDALQELRDKRSTMEAKALRHDEQAGQAAGQAETLRGRVIKAIGHDDPTVRRGEARAVVEALAGLVDALGKLEAATKERDIQLRAVNRQVVAAGFADHDAARDAKRPEEELEALEQRLEERRIAHQEARLGLQELEKQGVPEEAPDVSSAADASKEAVARVETLGGAVTRIDERCRNFEQAVDNALERVDEASGVSKVANRADRVDNVCRGIRGTRSLESWVLARHLRAIAAEASQRFQEVSAGRFVFTVVESLDEESQGPARLEITDHYNGETRAVSSLSGGETFQASLSLALGLADTVQQRQGGIHIDSLFVDEGFGSLDLESLDQAMDTLEELQEGGRTVGVISHVSEMKQRIAEGLRVVKTDRGSHIRAGRS